MKNSAFSSAVQKLYIFLILPLQFTTVSHTFNATKCLISKSVHAHRVKRVIFVLECINGLCQTCSKRKAYLYNFPKKNSGNNELFLFNNIVLQTCFCLERFSNHGEQIWRKCKFTLSRCRKVSISWCWPSPSTILSMWQSLWFYSDCLPSMKGISATWWSCIQGVTKRCRLSWLTNSALIYEPKCGGSGGGVVGSQPMSTAVEHMEAK